MTTLATSANVNIVGVFTDTAAIQTSVSGGRYRSTGGTTNIDFWSHTAGGIISLMGVDYQTDASTGREIALFSLGNLAAGSCTANDVRIDTGGATKELCFCSPGNTWNCATLTAGGPID
jgi:hypothetical protein